jgi:hypothetical protein
MPAFTEVWHASISRRVSMALTAAKPGESPMSAPLTNSVDNPSIFAIVARPSSPSDRPLAPNVERFDACVRGASPEPVTLVHDSPSRRRRGIDARDGIASSSISVCHRPSSSSCGTAFK